LVLGIANLNDELGIRSLLLAVLYLLHWHLNAFIRI